MLEIEASLDSAILLLGITEGNKTTMLKKHMNPTLTGALATRARTESTEVDLDGEWRDKPRQM